MKISYIEDFNEWKQGFSFSTPIKIRFSETDMFGHVNNVSPFIYFEEARITYMEDLNLFGELTQESKIAPIVGDLQCDFLQQIYFGDKIDLHVKANHVGNTSLDIHYMATNQKGEVCLVGRGRIVQIDITTGKPTPFTEQQQKVLQEA
ncbi:acyl-CoA thioesterase [Halalkalibacillus halophilus]|uniref:acyl-CoA thioesterase n=1 Tax=Halalkalibacillus halophilus TaxID=392827 RepID=UPI0004210D50|nr:acyl-CoA thioesterase [Halalkalibacillus halophilus]